VRGRVLLRAGVRNTQLPTGSQRDHANEVP
jgi:hypothetical protein